MICRALAHKDRGITAAEALKLSPWVVKNYQRMMKNFGESELEHMYCLALMLSARAKTSKKTMTELQELIFAICVGMSSRV